VKSRVLLPILLLLLTVTACTSGGGSSAAGTLRVGVISTSSQPYGIESWAYQQGILRKRLADAGIRSVTFTTFPNGPNLNQALKGGSLDLGVLGDTPAISGKAAGLPTELSGVSLRGQDAWLIAAPGVHTLSDLRGKTVATQQGSYMHRYLVGLLAQNGLTSSVKITFLLTNAAQQALSKNDIAAYAAPVPTAPQLVSKGFTAIDKASRHPGLEGNSYITISTAAAKKLKSDPNAYYTYAAKVSGLPVAVLSQSYLPAEFGDPALAASDLATVKTTLGFLVAQRLAASSFDVNSWLAPGVSAAQ
jgi:NitT/TauT family transport system substrate-binding protein/sulfonate transport system substrate-binding protein